jgi:hypothetical protein
VIAGTAATASTRLRAKIDLAIGPYATASASLFTHPRIAELWPRYLMTQHAIIRATVPLTEAAQRRARELAADDPFAGELAVYLAGHVPEELGHDETLLEDLEALGVERDSVVRTMPSASIASLVGAHYYWVLHHHPVALLGYIGVMEGYPPTEELVDELIRRTALPAAGFRTFLEHAELDPGHRDRLDRTLDALRLRPEHERIIGVSAIATAGAAACVLEELVAAADQGPNARSGPAAAHQAPSLTAD